MNHEIGFDEETVKKKIGDENYNAFIKWMTGQTVGVHPETQETIYYKWDVERFKSGLEKTVLGDDDDN